MKRDGYEKEKNIPFLKKGAFKESSLGKIYDTASEAFLRVFFDFRLSYLIY